MSRLTDAAISEILRAHVPTLHRRQVGRWRERGLAVERPTELVEQLAAQSRPGIAFEILSRPGVAAEAERAIARAKRVEAAQIHL